MLIRMVWFGLAVTCDFFIYFFFLQIYAQKKLIKIIRRKRTNHSSSVYVYLRVVFLKQNVPRRRVNKNKQQQKITKKWQLKQSSGF